MSTKNQFSLYMRIFIIIYDYKCNINRSFLCFNIIFGKIFAHNSDCEKLNTAQKRNENYKLSKAVNTNIAYKLSYNGNYCINKA